MGWWMAGWMVVVMGLELAMTTMTMLIAGAIMCFYFSTGSAIRSNLLSITCKSQCDQSWTYTVLATQPRFRITPHLQRQALRSQAVDPAPTAASVVTSFCITSVSFFQKTSNALTPCIVAW